MMECVFPILIFASLANVIFCSGKFGVSILAIYNQLGVLENKECCAGSVKYAPCFMECETFFSICLVHYSSQIADRPSCTYGKVVTPVLGGNIINKTALAMLNYFPLSMPFNFAWPGAFSLVIDVWHDAFRNRTMSDSTKRILRAVITEELTPSDSWVYNNSDVEQSHLWYKYRVICDENYYGNACDRFCRNRNDQFGHYICDEDGSKTCLPGWRGEFCHIAICASSCNSSNGFCEEPYECRCQFGWSGQSCERCIPNPACVHGDCKTPWQCICNDGWVGKNCDIDVMYCMKNEPCLNGGTCSMGINVNFSCSCPKGFEGAKCERSVCYPGYCKNDGKCQIISNITMCQCTESYYGKLCEFKKVTCEEIHCLHEGQCYHGEYGAMCNCKNGYTGIFCEEEINECLSEPCTNGASCLDGMNDFICKCPPHFLGKTCDIYLDPCRGYCYNQAKCSVSKSNYSVQCHCRPGYTGQRCETPLSQCNNVKCLNGGICKTLTNIADTLCICRTGYFGNFCEISVEPCTETLCLNGGTCKRYSNHSICICPQQYSGPQCDILLFPSDQHITQTPPPFDDVNATSSIHGSCHKLIIISAIAVTSSFLIVIFNTRRWCSEYSKRLDNKQ